MKNLLLTACALLLCATLSNAAITLTIEQVGSDAVFTYTGSIDVYTKGGVGNSNIGFVNQYGLTATTGSMEAMSTGVTLISGLWTTKYASGTASGDTLKFSNTQILVGSGYEAGDPINGVATFAGMDLYDDLGFTPGDSGTFSGGGNTINYTVANAVPEPSTFACLTGVFALGFIAMRSRVKRTKHS